MLSFLKYKIWQSDRRLDRLIVACCRPLSSLHRQ